MTTTTNPPVTVVMLVRWGWVGSRKEYHSPENCWKHRIKVIVGRGSAKPLYFFYAERAVPTPASESDLAELCRLLGIPRE